MNNPGLAVSIPALPPGSLCSYRAFFLMRIIRRRLGLIPWYFGCLRRLTLFDLAGILTRLRISVSSVAKTIFATRGAVALGGYLAGSPPMARRKVRPPFEAETTATFKANLGWRAF